MGSSALCVSFSSPLRRSVLLLARFDVRRIRECLIDGQTDTFASTDVKLHNILPVLQIRLLNDLLHDGEHILRQLFRRERTPAQSDAPRHVLETSRSQKNLMLLS